jgi:hypothetical protein
MQTDKAYFAGVLQSDGCIYSFLSKNKIIYRLNITVGSKSIEMLEKSSKVLATSFNRQVNIRKVPLKNSFAIQTSVNRDMPYLARIKKLRVPSEFSADAKLFGAYLAGLIDGDGHIKIKKNKDRTIPQCVIRITSDRPHDHLPKYLKRFGNCKTHFYKDKRSKAVETCFYLSKKNKSFFIKHVIPEISISLKRKRILDHYMRI